MTLGNARRAYSKALVHLLIQVETMRLEFAFDEVTERVTEKDPTSDHMPNSCHHVGLAADILLYKDGKYLTDSKDYEELGVAWEQLGAVLDLPLAWGGRFKNRDGNHFSMRWQGRA